MGAPVAVSAGLPDEVVQVLRDCGLLGPEEIPQSRRLEGGVSSEIWKVSGRAREFCVKRALAQLAVAQEWKAPVVRNRYERLWCETVRGIEPRWAPQVLAASDAAGLFAMPYYEPATHPVWKAALASGQVDVAFAAEVGDAIAQIHAGTAGREAIARTFATDELFEALRLDPYLRATARAHPDCAARLTALADQTRDGRIALVHGDVSPKNILQGPDGPLFLDAECAWYGDPAFDAAFCLNHLLLKCLWVPARREPLRQAFQAFANAYLARVSWEPAAACEARVAALLPALLLARIDGKSPVEYVRTDVQREWVRRFAKAYLHRPVGGLEELCRVWHEELG